MQSFSGIGHLVKQPDTEFSRWLYFQCEVAVATWMWPYLQNSWGDHRLACNHCRDSLRLGPLRGEPRSQSVSFPDLSIQWSGNESEHSHNASRHG